MQFINNMVCDTTLFSAEPTSISFPHTSPTKKKNKNLKYTGYREAVMAFTL